MRFLVWAASAWIGLWAVAATSVGAESPARDTAKAAAEAPRFRRVLAPAAEIDHWPRGTTKYLPVTPAEFDRLLKGANSGPRAARAGAHLSAAEYRAKLEHDRLVAGVAKLAVISTEKAPTTLSLSPCNLAVGVLQWSDDAARAVLAGLAADGRWHIETQRSGELTFPWALAGAGDAEDSVTFDLELPECPASVLLLELPADRVPVVERGVAEALDWTDEDVRLWQINLGGHNRVKLEVRKPETASTPGFAMLGETTHYALSLSGVEVTCEWTITAAEAAQRDVTLSVDKELSLTRVTCDGTAVAWNDGEVGDTARQVSLTLPDAAPQQARVIRLVAAMPLTTGREWSLPRVRPLGLFWRHGRMTVTVDPALQVKSLRGEQARQVASRMTTPTAASSAEYQCLSPDAKLTVAVEPAAAVVRYSGGSAIELSGTGATARFVGDFQAAGGTQFVAEAVVAGNWQIDSVETAPADRLEDWSIDRVGSQRLLTVRFGKPIVAAQPLRLLVTARRPGTLVGQKLLLRQLVPLQFRGVRADQRLIALRAVEPYQLEAASSAGPSGELRTLTPQQREWLGDAKRGPVFDEAAGDDVELVLRSQRPAFTADVGVEALVAGGRLSETFRIRCTPESGALEHLVVQCSTARDNPPQWTLAGPAPRPLVGRRLAVAAASAPNETWQITLPRPLDEPFEVIGTRDVPLEADVGLSLVGVQDATAQAGVCRIYYHGPDALRIKNTRLAALPTGVSDGQAPATLRGAFAFDPVREMAAAEPALAVALTPQAHAAWVWRAHCDSAYDAAGCGRHTVTLLIENAGARHIVLRAPDDVEVRGECELWVDRARVACSAGAAEKEELRVDLPPDKRFVTLTIAFTTAGHPLSAVGRVDLAMPKCDVPVIDRSWTVRLPPGYRAWDESAGRQRVPPAPPTLAQRLFGPLGRSPEASVAGLWPDSASSADDHDEPDECIEGFLKLLGGQNLPEAARATNATLTWGDLLAAAENNALADRVLIDQAAFQALGLTPRTTVKAASAAADVDRGLALLHAAGVAVLHGERAIVLTSRAAAANWQRELAPSLHTDVWHVEKGALGNLIAAATQHPDPMLAPADVWRQLADFGARPWQDAPGDAAGSADTRGWSVYEPRLATDGRASLTVCHEASVRWAGATVALAVLGIAWLMLRRRPRLFTLTLLLAVSAALLAPAALLPISAGVVIGLVLGALLAWLQGKSPEAPAAAEPPAAPKSTVAAASPPAMLLLLCLAVSSVTAAEKTEPPPAPVYDVYVPVDERQLPTGEKLYVPEPLYQELHRRVTEHVAPSQGWLIGGAVYRGELQKDASREQYSVGELQAEFKLHVFARASRVRLPLRRDDANLMSDTVTLDGEPLEVDWEADGSAIAFDVAEPGQYRLEFTLRPARVDAGIDLGIPPVLDARLELTAPTGAPEVAVTTARGATHWEAEPRRLVAGLGPTRRLTLHWAAPAPAAAAAIDVEQLLWWRLEPNAAALDVRLRLRVVEGQCRELRVTTDAALRACPPVGRDAPALEVEPVSASAQRLVFRWAKPITNAAVIDFSLVPEGGTAASVPRLDVPDARTTRRWVAVSIDPALETHQTDLEAVEAVPVADFVDAWGRTEAAPLVAVRPLSVPSPWQLATALRRSQFTADPTLTVSFGEEHAAVHFDAGGEVTGLPLFQLGLEVPAELETTGVEVRRGRDNVPLRWAVTADGRLTVFFDAPLAGPFTLSVRGHAPVGNRRRMTVPLVRFADGDAVATTLRVYRQPQVTAALPAVPGLTILPDTPPPLADGVERLGRPVAAYRVAPNVTKLWANVAPNRPTVTGTQLTVVRRVADGWAAEVHAQLNVEGGLLDEMHLEASDSVVGPFTCDLDTPVQMVDLPGERRRLTLRPTEALSGEVRLRLDARLAVPAAERLSAPLVRNADGARVRRFIALPRQVDGAGASWETIGLRTGDLGFAPPFEPADYDIYEISDDSSRATLMLSDRRQGAARVRQADVTVAWDENGECRGTAVFDLDMGRAVDCPLWMPAGLAPLRVTVDDLPVCPVRVGGHSHLIPFGPQRLPQRIEVLFAGRLPSGALPEQRIEMPTLGELPVARTLWTLYPPPGMQADADSAAGALSVAMARLRNTAGVIAQTAGSSALEEAQRTVWYRQWAARLTADYRLVQRGLAEQGRLRSVSTERAALRGINEEQTALADRLGLLTILGDVSAAERGPRRPTDVLRGAALEEGRQPICFESARPLSAVTVQLRPAVEPSRAGRWLLAAAAAALATALCVPWSRNRTRRVTSHAAWWAKRYPHAVGVLLGVAWLLWLSPIAIGWCILFGSLAALLWRATPRRPSAVRM